MEPSTEITVVRAQYIAEAERVSVVDSDTYAAALSLMRQIKALRAKIEDAFRPIIDAAHASHKAAIAQYRLYDDPLKKAESDLRTKAELWASEQRRKDAEAAAERERAVSEAVASGDFEKAAMAMTEHRTATPVVSGVQLRKRWTFRIVNPDLLPRKFLVPDESAIRKVVNALGPAAEIPGVEVYEHVGVAVRS